MELLKSKVPGLDAVHIPFGSNPQVVTAMIGGQIHLALVPPGIAMPQVRAGKLKAIGVTGGRSTLVPDVAPLADAGIADFNLEVWTALIGPANLPASVARTLSEAVVSTPLSISDRRWLANPSASQGFERKPRFRCGSSTAAMVRM